MEMNFKNIRKAEGEITYLFAAIFLSFFIIIYICIIVITTNYFNIEYHIREIANRISVKSLFSNENFSIKESIEKEFRNELELLRKNIGLKVNNKIIQEFLEENNFQIKVEEMSLPDSESIKLFKISYKRAKAYKIGGILNYEPRALAYICITLNEKIKGVNNEN